MQELIEEGEVAMLHIRFPRITKNSSFLFSCVFIGGEKESN